MARESPTKTSYALGEVSSGLLVDPQSPEYAGGCERFRNAMATITAGFRLRYGGEFATTLGFPSHRHFIYHVDGEAFVVVVAVQDSGPQFDLLAVFTIGWQTITWVPSSGAIGPLPPGNGSTYIGHNYTEAEVQQLRGRQVGRRFLLLHDDHPVIYLERRVDGKFAIGELPIDGGSPQVQCYRDANFLSGAGVTSQAVPYPIDATLDTFNRQDAIGTQPAGSRTPGMVLRFGLPRLSTTLNPHYGGWFHGTQYINKRRMLVDTGASAGHPPDPGYQFAPDDWCGPWVNTGVLRSITAAAAFSPDHTLHPINVWTDPGSTWTVEDLHKVFYYDGGANGVAYWWVMNIIPGSPTTIHARPVYDSYVGGIISGTISVTMLEIPARLMAGAPAIIAPSAQPPRGSVVNIRANRRVFQAGHATPFSYVTAGEGNPSHVGVGVGVGAAIFLNGGIARVDQFIDEYTVRGRVVKPFDHIGPTVRWGIGWNKEDGFPTCATWHQNRIWFSGFKSKGERKVVASRVFAHDDHTIGAQASDAINLDIEEVHGGRVAWMESSGADLLLGTTHAIKAARGLVTPTSFGFDHQSDHGSAADCESAQIGTLALFVTSDGKGIRTVAFSEASQRYQSTDITETAKHLFTSRIVEIHVVENPAQMLFARLAGGELIVCRLYAGVRELRSWSKWTFGSPLSDCRGLSVVRGSFSVSGSDEVHALVRAATGVSVAQRMMPSASHMDSAVTPIDMTATTVTIDTTLHAHLLQVPVQVVLDDVFVGVFSSDAGGVIDISALGLAAPPTTGKVGVSIALEVTLPPPALAFAGGSLAGLAMSIPSARLFLVGSRGGAVNGSPIHDQALPLPNPTDPVTVLDGWRLMSGIETDPDSVDLTITHTEPYYFEVAAVASGVEYGS